MNTHPVLTPERVLEALRAHPEGATEADIRYAARPGQKAAHPILGPASHLVWPDRAQVVEAIDATRAAGWIVRADYQPWAHTATHDATRVASCVYVLAGQAPLQIRDVGAGRAKPTPSQLALPEKERMIAFLVDAGGGGVPVEWADVWGLRHLGAPNSADARPWVTMALHLEKDGWCIDWWPGPGGMGRVRLAAMPPVTVQEARVILGLSYPGANDLLRRRGLKPVGRIGNVRIYDRSAILRLAAEARRSGRPPVIFQDNGPK